MTILKRAGLFASSVILVLAATTVNAQDDVNLDGEDERIAYAIGSNIGQNLAAQGLLDGLDVNVFIAGMLDAIGGTSQMSQEEMVVAIQMFQQRAQEQAVAQMSANLAAAEEFLSENAGRDGVVALDSGLQYLVLES
ncbi:MAG: FKBP-type peptidyl-prolyl cis-trans isomerase N-terminal domain-containing protein, partial [Gammaproteobacteria bacterium]